MSSVISIGIWSLSLKIWFKSVAAETRYQKKDGSFAACPSVETCSLSAALQEYIAQAVLLSDSVSQHLWKMKSSSALQTLWGRNPNLCSLIPCRKHIWGRQLFDRYINWGHLLELHVDRHLKHSQHWHRDTAIWAKFVHYYTTWGGLGTSHILTSQG